MKKVVAALALMATFSAKAVEVTAIGYGATVESATQNAKNIAVEQAAGTFLVTSSTVMDDSFRSSIDQYSGGVIKTYTVLNVGNNGDLVEVTIQADIDADKINRIIVPTSDVPVVMSSELAIAQEKAAKAREMVQALDRRSDAFVINGKILKYVNRGEVTDLTVAVEMKWSPKWYDDVRKFSQMAGKQIHTDNSLSDALGGIGAILTPFNFLASTVATGAARKTEKPQKQSPVYAYCFSKTSSYDVDDCFEIGYGMPNVTDKDRWAIWMTLSSNGRIVKTFLLGVENNNQLFVNVRTGSRLYFVSSAAERKFTNPGVVLFQKGVTGDVYTYTVDTDMLRSIDGIEYILCSAWNLESRCN